MMFGGTPAAITAVGAGMFRSTGDWGGLISTALMFCAKGCSTVAGTYPSPGLAASVPGGGAVTAAPVRTGDRDLHGGGAADEYRFGAARTRRFLADAF